MSNDPTQPTEPTEPATEPTEQPAEKPAEKPATPGPGELVAYEVEGIVHHGIVVYPHENGQAVQVAPLGMTVGVLLEHIQD